MKPIEPPEGMRLLTNHEHCQKGDFWFRPYDGMWIETGVAHWGLCPSVMQLIARRKEKYDSCS